MSKQAGRMSQGANDFLAPYAPTIGTATDVGTNRPYNNGAAIITFTATGPNPADSFTAYAVEDATKTVTGSSSPLTVTGLASGTNYTFKVYGTNAAGGKGEDSSASNQITATTVPQTPTVASATNTCSGRGFNDGLIVVAVSAGATGGKEISNYFTVSNDGRSASGGSSTLNITGLTGGVDYTFQVRVSNANGDSELSASSSAVTATTVPATPGAPSASSPQPGVDVVSWNAPSNGGSPITNYFWAASDGKSGNTGSTSVSVGQEENSSQTYTVRADNACGSSGTSPASGNVTTTVYSFVPFSAFGAFGAFSAFGAFGAFGAFNAFGAFGAFGAFNAFGAFGAFNAFGAFGAYSFVPAKSVGLDTLVLTTEGYVAARNLKKGDVLVSANVPGLGMSFTREEMEAWTNNPENITIVADQTTTIMDIGTSTASLAVMIGNELYSGTHYMLAERDGVAKMIKSQDLVVGDKLWSTKTNSWQEILDLVITEVSHEVVSINCEPIDMFFTENYLVYDGYQIEY